jgi:hypothetical protein
MYVHLARKEEAQASAEFGSAYANYARNVPAFIPRLGSSSGDQRVGGALIRRLLE